MIKEGVDLVKSLLGFIPAKWRVRGEVKAKREGQLAVGETSLQYWERLGWSPEGARYLATAFAFGVKENVAAVLEKAQDLSDSQDFESQFLTRISENPSIIGAALEASKFTSSEELRDLLGRILASDAGNPDSVSRRAVSVAQDLTPKDLQEFLKLRAVTWRGAKLSTTGCMLVMGERMGLYGEKFLSFDSNRVGVEYHTFAEFQQLGLLQEHPYGISLRFEGEIVERRLINGERAISLRPTSAHSELQLGNYALTKAGSEILSLFFGEKFRALDGYFDEVCEHWQEHGFEVAELNERGEST